MADSSYISAPSEAVKKRFGQVDIVGFPGYTPTGGPNYIEKLFGALAEMSKSATAYGSHMGSSQAGTVQGGKATAPKPSATTPSASELVSSAITSRFSLPSGAVSGYDPVAQMKEISDKLMADFPTNQGLSDEQMKSFMAPYIAAIGQLSPPPGQDVPPRQKALPVFIMAALANIGSALSRNPEFAHIAAEKIQGDEEQRKAVEAHNYLEKQAFNKDIQLQRLAAIGKLTDVQFENAIHTNDAQAALKAEAIKEKLAALKEGVQAKARIEEQKISSAATLQAATQRSGPKPMSLKDYNTMKIRIAGGNEKNLAEVRHDLGTMFGDVLREHGLVFGDKMSKDDMILQVAVSAAQTEGEAKPQAMMDVDRVVRKIAGVPSAGPLNGGQIQKYNKIGAPYNYSYTGPRAK